MRQSISMLCLIFLTATSSSDAYATESSAPKKIRIIFGYENIGQWEQEFTGAIAKNLLEDPRVVFHTQYMTLDVEDSTSHALFKALEQIRPSQADAIITVRPEAATFVNQWKDAFFPDIPIIYAAPGNNIAPDELAPATEAIVVSGIDASVRATFEFLPKILPEVEHIYVFSGDRTADTAILTRIKNIISESDLQQTVHYLVGLTPSEMSTTLNAAPENTVAVFGLYTQDRTGQSLQTGNVASIVQRQTDKPIFGLFVSTLNSGITGVTLTPAAFYGKRAAEQALALLFDDALPTNMQTATSHSFDAQQLDHFGIDPGLLPEGSEIFNIKPNILRRYWWQFTLGGMVFVAQLFFILALGRSLHRRDKAEAESKNSIAAMHEAQRIAHVGSWQLDLASGRVTWTPELYYMQGLEPTLEPPNFIEQSKLFTPESLERLSVSLGQTVESGKPYELDLEMVKPDGGHGRMLARGEAVRDEAGVIVGIRGTAIDTTAHHAMSEQLRRSQKMEAFGQLTSGIAHDFNNILAIIMGNLELAKDRASGDKEIFNDVERAFGGVVRGADLVNKLLGFSRDQTQQVSSTSVSQLIDNMDDMLAKSLTVSIKIETQLEDSLWLVNVDAGDLESAILNLALNARDAMPDGGKLTIETANKVLDEDFITKQPEARIGDYVMLSARDTGIGMAPAVMEKILEPFFTTKIDGKGTGLGLSMVYGFVKRSGGFITIYSEPDAGTSINIFLPRGSDAEQFVVTTTDQDELPRGDETVLVVDDEVELTRLAAANLERFGYKVLTAVDGKSALALIKDHPNIDLLCSDVVMPGEFDGYLLAITVRNTHPTLKILLTSGFTYQQEDEASSNSPLVEELTRNLLRKPYNQAELVLAVRNALDG